MLLDGPLGLEVRHFAVPVSAAHGRVHVLPHARGLSRVAEVPPLRDLGVHARLEGRGHREYPGHTLEQRVE